jgi:hypothetical protein
VRCSPPLTSTGGRKVRSSPSSTAPVRPARQACGRRRRPRQTKKRGRRPPELVIGLSLRSRDDRRGPPPSRLGRMCARGAAGGRTPVHQRLGPRVPDVVAHLPRHRRFSPPDRDGWSKVLPRRSSRPAWPRTTTSHRDPAPRRCLPPQLDGRCLNCLSYSHHRATCTRPTRCLRCFNLHHIARECKRLHTSPTDISTVGVVHLPRRELRRSAEASPAVMPRGSTKAGSTPRGDVTPWGSAAAGLTPPPPPRGRVALHPCRRCWMPSRYASPYRETHPCVGAPIRCCSSGSFASRFRHRGQSSQRWTLPHHRLRLQFRRASRRTMMSQPVVTLQCPPCLLALKIVSTASWMQSIRSQPLPFSRPRPVSRCSWHHPGPLGAAAQDSPITNLPEFRFPVVGRSYSRHGGKL